MNIIAAVTVETRCIASLQLRIASLHWRRGRKTVSPRNAKTWHQSFAGINRRLRCTREKTISFLNGRRGSTIILCEMTHHVKESVNISKTMRRIGTATNFLRPGCRNRICVCRNSRMPVFRISVFACAHISVFPVARLPVETRCIASLRANGNTGKQAIIHLK